MEKFWKCPPVGSQMGSGKLDTMDDKVLFVGPNGRSILLTDNANGRDGLWQVNWWECIIDNKFIDYQDREAAGCGDMDPRNPNTYAVDATYGFSFDETTKASCKKLVKANRRVGQDNAEDIITDITEEWKNIDCSDLKLRIDKVLETLSKHPFFVSNPENARKLAEFRVFSLKKFQ